MFGRHPGQSNRDEQKPRPSKSPIRGTPQYEPAWSGSREAGLSSHLNHSANTIHPLKNKDYPGVPTSIKHSNNQKTPKVKTAATRLLLNQLMDLIENRLSTKLNSLEERSARNVKSVKQLQAAFARSEREIFTISALFRSKEPTANKKGPGSDLITEDIRGFFNLVKGQLGMQASLAQQLPILQHEAILQSKGTHQYYEDEEEDQDMEVSRSRYFVQEEEPYREFLKDLGDGRHHSKQTDKLGSKSEIEHFTITMTEYMAGRVEYNLIENLKPSRSRSITKPAVPARPRSPLPSSTQKPGSRTTNSHTNQTVATKTPSKPSIPQTRASKSPSPVPSQPKRVPASRQPSKQADGPQPPSGNTHGQSFLHQQAHNQQQQGYKEQKLDSKASTSTKANTSGVSSSLHQGSKQSGRKGCSQAANSTLNISLSLDQSRQQEWNAHDLRRRGAGHVPQLSLGFHKTPSECHTK